MNNDFLCEKRLSRLDSGLHRRVCDTAFVMQFTLEKYKAFFPEYTDHTILHSMQVIDFCNNLIGTENIDKLNADELYVLLMACYLHDSGMGLTEDDYRSLYEKVISPEYIKTHPGITTKEIIRDFHNEFSGSFILKHAPVFDIPSDEHIHAIIQLSRGHRKTDLYDPEDYPTDYRVPSGNTICLPYLSALIRLADELDIAADRNIARPFEPTDNVHVKCHVAIKHMRMEKERFVIEAYTSDPEVRDMVTETAEKLEKTLRYCRDVVEKRTVFRISQGTVTVNMHEGE